MLNGVEWHRVAYRDQGVRVLQRNSNFANAVAKSKETVRLRDLRDIKDLQRLDSFDLLLPIEGQSFGEQAIVYC
jgi:hypothetical protein